MRAPRRREHATASVALCALAALLAGCGGGAGGGTEGARTPRAAPGVPTSSGGDNSIQTWGHEASAAARRAVAGVVHAFLDARARADWARACGYLAAEQRRSFEGGLEGSRRISCAKGMAELAAGVPARAFEEEARIGRVLSLRLGGGRGFLIYTRPDGGVYATAVRLEGGAWKVVSVGPTALS